MLLIYANLLVPCLYLVHLILLPGLSVTLQKMPHNGVVLLFTDSPSKNLQLEAELIAIRDEKKITIFVVLTPGYFGTKHDASWKVYVNLSEGRIYDLLNFDKDQFFQEVVHVIGSSCAGKVSSDLVGSSSLSFSAKFSESAV